MERDYTERESREFLVRRREAVAKDLPGVVRAGIRTRRNA